MINKIKTMKNYKKILLFILILFTTICNSQNVYWVNNTNDFGLGSFRQAIIDANSLVSNIADTIRFNIPGNSVHTISPTYNLPLITDPVYIDGLSQPGTSINSWPAILKIELEGSLIGANGEGLIISSGRSTIKGLIINRFGLNGVRLITGGLNKVETCFIGTDSTGYTDLGNGRNGVFIGYNSSNNKIGGNNYQLRNLISGNDLTAVTIDGANTKHNEIKGNYIGTDASGLGSLGNGGKAGVWEDLYRTIYLNNGSSYNTIGGINQDDRNIISGNLGHGIYINSGTFNTVQNNYIGVDASGGNALGNEFSGIVIYAGQFNTIGGIPTNGLSNVISDNDVGITLMSYSNPAKFNDIFDNIIGLSAGGAPMGNGTGMILSMNAIENEIQWNTIASNLGNGVSMIGDGVYNNVVILNEIYLNNDLGIDLNDDGPTANDTNDSDGGSNQSQNFPVLTKAFLNDNGKIEIEGTLGSIPNKDYTIYFYANSRCNSSETALNFGEGEKPIGDISVTTTSSGDIDFSIELEGMFAPGRHITALAVDENRNTSEFSACISISNWPSLGFGLNDEVRAVVIDSNGVVYAGGDFTLAGNIPINYLAKWDGTGWSNVGGGTNAPVYALHFDRDGNLLVGGDFTSVGSDVPANRIAKWDGNTWSSFGLGMNDRVKVIASSQSGTIYAGGDFTSADGNTQIQGIARWNLSQWVGLGAMPYNVKSIVVTPSAEVIAGGNFTSSTPPYNYTIAKWDGANWTGLYNSSTAGVNALALKSNGNVFAADGHRLLEYDGNTWNTLLIGSGHANIETLILNDDENLFLGGQFYFTDSQGRSVRNIAMWDGSNFYTLGGGLQYFYANSITIKQNNLFVGGKFTLANGVPADNIAKLWIDYALPRSNELNKVDTLEDRSSPTKIDVKIYPNPFSSIVNIDYSLLEDSEITIEIFDINSQLVKSLFQGYLNQGTYSTSWDGRSSLGNPLMSGLYFCTIKTDFSAKTYKLFLFK